MLSSRDEIALSLIGIRPGLPADRPRPRIVVVLNWFDELRAKVPL